jgi:hypothetical protein
MIEVLGNRVVPAPEPLLELEEVLLEPELEVELLEVELVRLLELET